MFNRMLMEQWQTLEPYTKLRPLCHANVTNTVMAIQALAQPVVRRHPDGLRGGRGRNHSCHVRGRIPAG